VKKDKLFCKRLVELLVWYDPELKKPKEMASNMLDDLKNTIENSECLTCSEESENEGENELQSKSDKKKYLYPKRFWHCKDCNKTMTLSNKCNHLRSTKHEINVLYKNDTCK
jgi:uncharacterized protein with PIN domain